MYCCGVKTVCVCVCLSLSLSFHSLPPGEWAGVQWPRKRETRVGMRWSASLAQMSPGDGRQNTSPLLAAISHSPSPFLSPSLFFSVAEEHIVLRCFFSRPLLHYRILSPKSKSRHCDCSLCRAESVSVRASLSVYSLIEFKGWTWKCGTGIQILSLELWSDSTTPPLSLPLSASGWQIPLFLQMELTSIAFEVKRQCREGRRPIRTNTIKLWGDKQKNLESYKRLHLEFGREGSRGKKPKNPNSVSIICTHFLPWWRQAHVNRKSLVWLEKAFFNIHVRRHDLEGTVAEVNTKDLVMERSETNQIRTNISFYFLLMDSLTRSAAVSC